MKNVALRTAGTLLILVGLAHALRLALDVPVLVGGAEAPGWASGAAIAVVIPLGFWMWSAGGGGRS